MNVLHDDITLGGEGLELLSNEIPDLALAAIVGDRVVVCRVLPVPAEPMHLSVRAYVDTSARAESENRQIAH